jgi:hypothetical protein
MKTWHGDREPDGDGEGLSGTGSGRYGANLE